MSSDNEAAATSWVEAIRNALPDHGSPGSPLIIVNRTAPPFRLRAVSNLAPVFEENWNAAVGHHEPVVGHYLLEELAREGIGAHLHQPPVVNEWAWLLVALRTIEAEIDYSGYDIRPDSAFAFPVSFDLDINVRRPRKTHQNNSAGNGQ